MPLVALLFATVVAWHGERAKTYPLTMRAAKAAIIAAHASHVGPCTRTSARSVLCEAVVNQTNANATATLTRGRHPHVRVVFRHRPPALPALKPRGE
jgi:hypothetical protein